MAAHPALQMVAVAARLDGRLRPLAGPDAVFGPSPPPLYQASSRRRTLLRGRRLRRRSFGLLHPILQRARRRCPFFQRRRRSEERRVGKECRSLCDWSSDVCSSDLSDASTWPASSSPLLWASTSNTSTSAPAVPVLSASPPPLTPFCGSSPPPSPS